MKISPVQGVPTLPQTPLTGLSPDKIARLKDIASGKQPTSEEEKPEVIPQVAPPSNKTIKMQTKSPEAIDASQQVPAEATATEESALSDTGVQTKPVTEAIQQVSPQIAALAKEKRALQVKERELAEQRKAIEEQLSQYKAREERIKSGQALSVLQEDYGVTYDQLTNEILGKQSQIDPNKLKSDFEKIVDERFAAKDKAQEQAVFEHMSKNVNKLTFASDEYPFIKTGKAQEKVMELIRRTWQEQGEVLDEEEACQLIEAELKEDARLYAKLLNEPDVTNQDATEPQSKPAPSKPGIKTLTNKDSARPPMSRRQRAIAAALGQNK